MIIAAVIVVVIIIRASQNDAPIPRGKPKEMLQNALVKLKNLWIK
jgi:hypothetical protein